MIKSLCNLQEIKCNIIYTRYEQAYCEKDFNKWPSISFPVASSFKYNAGPKSYLLSSSDILFEKSNLEFEVSKLPMFKSDTTITVRFLDTDHEAINSFLKRRIDTGIINRTPRIDYMLAALANSGKEELFKEQALLDILSTIRYKGNATGIKINPYTLKLIDTAKEYITANFFNKIQMPDIAASVFISPFHFCRLFKKVTGISPYQYLLAIRIEEAKKLLAEGETVSKTAFKTGFQSLEHFSHSFTQHENVGPSFLKKRSKS